MKVPPSLLRAVDQVDAAYIIRIRRELHQYPEIGFDLPRTVGVVRRELDALGVSYTEKYAPCSVVATMGKGSFTLGIRADMDALPIRERNKVPYRSRIDGVMHACGHDAHTAMLLGTARALKTIEHKLSCRVKLLFQPCEEGAESGARVMVKNGVMKGVDRIIGLHVEGRLEAGTVGVCPGLSMAASNPVILDFYGRTAHATLPHTGRDALAMAVKTYMGIQTMLTREINPVSRVVCSVGELHAGNAINVIADHACMKISLRAFEKEVLDFVVGRIRRMAKNAAAELGGRVNVDSRLKAPPVMNDPPLGREVLDSARATLGADNIAEMPAKMSSEDFSFFSNEKPGVFWRVGIRNAAKGFTAMPHNDDFNIDEDALAVGSRVCVRFVLDQMVRHK